MLHQYIVTEDESDQRVDRFLKKIFSGAPATFFYKMGRTKKVRINGKKTEPGDRIYVSDRVDVYLNAEEFSHYTTFIEPIAKVPNSKILTSAQILYEDDSLLIVDKSPGLNVHPGDHKTTEASLIQLVQDYL